jgi:hypothetical protein
VESRPERLTGDAGAVILREVFSRLGLDQFFEERLVDPRFFPMVVHPQVELVRTAVVLLGQGYQDQDDADRLRDDPALRLAVSNRRGVSPLQAQRETEQVPEGLASQPTLSRLVATLSTPQHREVLRESLLETAARRLQATRGQRLRYVTLDIDSLPVEVHGHQEGSAFNGYYGMQCYHPLVAMVAETGDLLDVRLREGNAHTAEGALDFVLPLLDRMERDYCQVASVRMDAGFPEDTLLSGLENRRVGYVARLQSNSRLKKLAAPLLSAFQTDEAQIALHELTYQADSWSTERRVVLVLQKEQGELFPRSFFLLTNWSAEDQPPAALLALYRRRGTAEGHFGELMDVLGPALSSTRRPKSHYRGQPPRRRHGSGDPFAANEVKLLLNALAYNLVHAVRVLMENLTGQGWGLRSVVEKVLRVPARLLLHSRRVVLVLNQAKAKLWTTLWKALGSWRWTPRPRPV